MKAIVYSKYGSPDVLRVEEITKPIPGDNELLIKVQATSANPADWHLMRGEPFIARLTSGLFKPQQSILGIDIAGKVEAVGKNVTAFQPGDELFGGCGWGGGFAEFVCVTEKDVERKPANISFAEAAAVPVAAITALQGLRHKGPVEAGQKVLINGGSGGVGTFTVQIAKAMGAEVTAVCSTRNLDMVRSLGADHVIDYTQEDFSQIGQRYDLIVDNVGNHSVSDLKRALNAQGTCVVVGFSSLSLLFQHMLLGALASKKGGQSIGLMGTAQINKDDLAVLKDLLETGKVVPVIDRCYPLNEAAEAIRYLETGHARGKVVISVAETS